jgi:hypothetical protein
MVHTPYPATPMPITMVKRPTTTIQRDINTLRESSLPFLS